MKKICGLFLALIALNGCYKDKGNYDYRDIKELTIEEFEEYEVYEGYYKINVSVGDRIVIDPVVAPNIGDDMSNYEIKWYIKDYTRDDWNKLRFDWVADFKAQNNEQLRIEIKDLRTDITYYQSIYITINPAFVSSLGLLVLSDHGGDSRLGYLSYTARESRPDPIDHTKTVYYPTEWDVFYNVYEQQNGEKLGTGPISLHEHYIDNYGGQYLVFQQSGAVDIDRDYLRKDIAISETFEGGSYPSGVNYLSSGSFMEWMDAVTDQAGHIYTRYKSVNTLYNTGLFDKSPVEFEGAALKNCTIYRNPYATPKSALINDPDKGRLLLMFEGGNGDRFGDNNHMNAGMIVKIPDCSWESAPYRSFNDLGDCEILNVTIREKNWSPSVNMTYRETGSGKYYIQQTELDKSYYGTILTNYGGLAEEITIPATVHKVYMPTYGDYQYLYLAAGDQLYFLDLDSGLFEAHLYFTADSKITAMYSHDYQAGHLLIGTEGGYVYELDTANAKNKISSRVDDDKKILFKLGGFDKIVDIIRPRNVNHQNYK